MIIITYCLAQLGNDQINSRLVKVNYYFQIKMGDKTCWMQLGIATFGGPCNKISPEYYTDVTTIHSWIKQKIQPKGNYRIPIILLIIDVI